MSESTSRPTKEEGLRLIKAGDFHKAVEVLDHVVETDPNDAQAFLYMGAAYAEIGNKAEAIASFEQSVSIKPSARAHFNLGVAYESVERLGEAMTQYQFAARMDGAYKPAIDAIERLKQQGIVPQASTVQWTLGAASVGEELATRKQAEQEQLTQQMAQTGQTTAIPPQFTPGAPQGQTTAIPPQFAPGTQPGSRPFLPGEREAIEEAKLRKHQMQMTKSGLLYGMLVGPASLGAATIIRYLLFPVGLLVPNLIAMVIVGLFIGALIGAVCGYTGGDEGTGEKIGAATFALVSLVAGLLNGAGVFVIISVVFNGVLGFIAGKYIGRLVTASIGWD